MSISGNIIGFLGYYKHSRGAYEEAEKLYARAVEKGLKNIERLGAYAVLVMRRGDFEYSIEMFDKLILTRPKAHIRLRIRLNRAIAYTKVGRYEEAKAAFEDIHEKMRSKKVYEALGYLYALTNDEKAESYNLEAFDYDPVNTVILDNLAQLYINQDNFDEARKYAELAFKESEDKVDVLYHLALIEEHDGNDAKAKEYAQKMMTVNITPMNDVTKDELLKTYRRITGSDWEIKKIE